MLQFITTYIKLRSFHFRFQYLFFKRLNFFISFYSKKLFTKYFLKYYVKLLNKMFFFSNKTFIKKKNNYFLLCHTFLSKLKRLFTARICKFNSLSDFFSKQISLELIYFFEKKEIDNQLVPFLKTRLLILHLAREILKPFKHYAIHAFISLPVQKKIFVFLKSPHTDKKSRDILELRTYTTIFSKNVAYVYMFLFLFLLNIFLLAGCYASHKLVYHLSI